MELSIALKIHYTKLQSIPNNWCNFYVAAIKRTLEKSLFKMLGLVQKRHDTLFTLFGYVGQPQDTRISVGL